MPSAWEGPKSRLHSVIKHWEVGEHTFIHKIQPLFEKALYFFRGGKGFYNAGELSEEGIDEASHKKAALETLAIAEECSRSGKYDIVICDEINNAVHDGLLKKSDLSGLIKKRHANTSLCLTGRNFPEDLIKLTDIATEMTKLKHHFDDRYLANKGVDY